MTKPLKFGFDLQAMANPKSQADINQLFAEALKELSSLNEQFDQLDEILADNAKAKLHGPPKPAMAIPTYTYGSMTKTAAQWAEYFGVTFQYFYSRMMVNGWSYTKAIEEQMKRQSER